jgi:hypothetical protein
VHGYVYLGPIHPWDSNWLNVTACCGDDRAHVWVSGAILMTLDIQEFVKQCDALYRDKKGEIVFAPPEPNLRVHIRPSDSLGHLAVTVNISPEPTSQRHSFELTIDLSYLPAIISQCNAILSQFPRRGAGWPD